MSESETTPMRGWWLQALERLGFPIVVALILLWKLPDRKDFEDGIRLGIATAAQTFTAALKAEREIDREVLRGVEQRLQARYEEILRQLRERK